MIRGDGNSTKERKEFIGRGIDFLWFETTFQQGVVTMCRWLIVVKPSQAATWFQDNEREEDSYLRHLLLQDVMMPFTVWFRPYTGLPSVAGGIKQQFPSRVVSLL